MRASTGRGQNLNQVWLVSDWKLLDLLFCVFLIICNMDMGIFHFPYSASGWLSVLLWLRINYDNYKSVTFFKKTRGIITCDVKASSAKVESHDASCVHCPCRSLDPVHTLNIYFLFEIKFKATNNLFDVVITPHFPLLVERVLFLLNVYVKNPKYIYCEPYAHRPVLVLITLYYTFLFTYLPLSLDNIFPKKS